MSGKFVQNAAALTCERQAKLNKGSVTRGTCKNRTINATARGKVEDGLPVHLETSQRSLSSLWKFIKKHTFAHHSFRFAIAKLYYISLQWNSIYRVCIFRGNIRKRGKKFKENCFLETGYKTVKQTKPKKKKEN